MMRAANWAIQLAAVLSLTVVARCQEIPPAAPDTALAMSRETYRLRVENAKYGRIELSIDGGEHFVLVGRVLKPAAVATPGADAEHPGSVVRSSGDGFAFGVAPGQIIKILPDTNVARRGKLPGSAITTDIKPHTGIFGEDCPPLGTAALQQPGHGAWRVFPNGFTPSEDDWFGFVIPVPEVRGIAAVATAPPDPAVLARLTATRKRLAALADDYASQAIARARAGKRDIVSGLVILRAKLPSGEPEPITAVTYSIDGDIVSAQNTLPSTYGWNTARVSNGEHVIEIRALSKYATVVTRVRVLVLVSNP